MKANNILLLELADFFINFDIDKKSGKNLNGSNTLTQNGGTDRVKPIHFHLYNKKDRSYSLEIDLQRLLCLDIIYFVMIKDKKGKER